MFTLADTPVKFVALLVLFLWCTAWSVYELTRPQDRTQRVSNVLHLVMSLVMLLMVSSLTWKPFAALIPGPAQIAVFVLATAWFIGLAVTRRASRGHYLGHAAMFGAMAWHLVGMVIKMPLMSAGMQSTGSGMGGMNGMGGMQHGGSGMPGASTGMGGMSTGSGLTPLAAASQPGGSVWIVALVGIPFMVYLLVAAVRDLVTAVRPTPAGHGHTTGHHHASVPAQTLAVADTDGTEHITTHTAHATQTVEQPQASVATCHEVRPTGSVTFRLAALAGFAMNFGMFWMSTGLLTPILPWMKLLAF